MIKRIRTPGLVRNSVRRILITDSGDPIVKTKTRNNHRVSITRESAMNKKVITLTFFIASFVSASLCQAQIALKLEMNRQDYIRFEPIFVKIIMRNDSGHAVAFGDHEKLRGKLLFDVRNIRNRVPEKPLTDKSYPIQGTILRPGEIRDFIVPLNKYYKLRDDGRYRIHAYVEHGMFQHSYRSNENAFEIHTGVVIWQRTVGIPALLQSKDSNQVKTRNYLVRSIFEGNRKTFFLTIEDKNKIYSVRRIGHEVGEENMTCDVDMLSRLHILLPASPQIFNYFVFDIDGRLEQREVFKRSTTIPTLVRDPESGKVQVAGGEKAKENVDYYNIGKDGFSSSSPPPANTDNH